MAFSRVAALLHAALSDVTATDHHTATDAGDLNLADLAENLHASLSGISGDDHLFDVTIAQMETETATARSLRPDRVRHSPGVAKVWVSHGVAGDILASYNVDSVTDTAVGQATVVITDDFSTANYAITGMIQHNGAILVISLGAITVGSYRTDTKTDADVLTDPSTGMMTAAFGDQ